MRSRRRMSWGRFERLHPGMTLVSERVNLGSGKSFHLIALRQGVKVAELVGRDEAALIADISERIYRLNARDAMAEQGWRETGTGALQPLQAHHIKARSKGRDDSKENLSGVTAGTHAKLHEKRHLARRPETE